jgi:tRNA U34 2-thiouridine synthase MnmA/TrmU
VRYLIFAVKSLIDDYREDITPSLDILCDQFVNFEILTDIPRVNISISIAIGCYYKKKNKRRICDLIESKDENKD